jgi:hypothetical protein
VLTIALISVLSVSLFAASEWTKDEPHSSLNCFVGVDAAYDDVEEIKRLVDEVKSYTNLFVIGSTGITYNRTKLDDLCHYIYDRGLYFMFYAHPTDTFSQAEWIAEARQRWPNHFLGLYGYDEPGGYQIDRCTPYMMVQEADNYTDAANKYVERLNEWLNLSFTMYMRAVDFPLFTSDYALYWFDYRAGYDVVFAEFGWNYSRQLNVALCRGAASVQNKEWGVMITWTYNDPPYIESGEELYDDLVLAYNNGAKYILVFDTSSDYTHGILKEEHLEALKRFWNYANHSPPTRDASTSRFAYVLPKDYGYGFRGPYDKIWGLWEADSLSNKLCTNLYNIMQKHGTNLDIIYDDKKEPYNISIYKQLIFWNGTIYTIQ